MFKEYSSTPTEATGARTFDHPVLHGDAIAATEETRTTDAPTNEPPTDGTPVEDAAHS